MEHEIQILNIDDILPNRFQPRIQFNDRNINELADSIKEHGVIQPIVVRKVSDKFEIIAGERRYKASILAGKTTIPAIITNLDDKNSAEVALIENVQRQDLTPIEEAVSYKKILDMGYITQGDLAEKLGKTQSTIANKLRLLNLDDEVQEALLDGKISERHARSLLKLDNIHQIIMLNRIIDERLTVRKTDEEIEKMVKEDKNIKLKNESGEEKMDQMEEKIINQFNIPSNPIIEPKEEPIYEIEKTDSINPGFMDISKIEEEAEDIFKDEKTADINMLLEKTEVPELEPMSPMAPVQPIINEENTEKSQFGGKFFNMFNFKKEEENPNFVENLENKEVNIDFGIPTAPQAVFNPFVTTQEEKINMQPEQEENINKELFDNNKEEIDNQQATNFFNNFDTNERQDIEVKPEVNTSNFEIPVEEDLIFNPINPYTLNEESQFSIYKESNQIPTTEENSVVQPFSSVEPIYNEIDEIPTIKEAEVITSNENNVQNKDFKIIINTIRECAKTIEKMGYKIDTEEIDFENDYQVIFKIEK
ncbi:MAG: ParB/RepB/Spo0J family partition protein [Bacilli bacterium]|nr:ParB/RepB/Spo0J family partition protein [Bacilli bacterium]